MINHLLSRITTISIVIGTALLFVLPAYAFEHYHCHCNPKAGKSCTCKQGSITGDSLDLTMGALAGRTLILECNGTVQNNSKNKYYTTPNVDHSKSEVKGGDSSVFCTNARYTHSNQRRWDCENGHFTSSGHVFVESIVCKSVRNYG